MVELLNYGWTFEQLVNFVSISELWNFGWTFILRVTFWILGEHWINHQECDEAGEACFFFFSHTNYNYLSQTLKGGCHEFWNFYHV